MAMMVCRVTPTPRANACWASEKPMATSLCDARALVDEASRAGRSFDASLLHGAQVSFLVLEYLALVLIASWLVRRLEKAMGSDERMAAT